MPDLNGEQFNAVQAFNEQEAARRANPPHGPREGWHEVEPETWASPKNGRQYVLRDVQGLGHGVEARYHGPSGRLNHHVGSLSYFGGRPEYSGSNTDGGVIYKVGVKPRHQRAGLATAMLDFARRAHPDHDVRHSSALSDDGAAWRQAVE